MEDQLEGTASTATTAYRPQPPRPFRPRSGSGKRAGQRDEYYWRNREKILTERHNKSMKAREERAEPTAKQKHALHVRRSKAKKKHWKEASPQTKAGSLRALDAGRAIMIERSSAKRHAVEIIARRVNGTSIKGIAETLKFSTRKPVRTAVRSVDLPNGKRYLCYRGKPFTRKSGTDLYKALGWTSVEFARLIGVRDRRTAIWLTAPSKNLDPKEAQSCIDLHDKIARRLLDRDGGQGFDAYNRGEVLAALYPRFREEYQLLRAAFAGLRSFLQATASAEEHDIAEFFIRQAQAEKRGELPTSCYREVIPWLFERSAGNPSEKPRDMPPERLPQLMPIILKQGAQIAGTGVLNCVVPEILADTMGAPANIVRHTISGKVQPTPPSRMRELLRIYPTSTVAEMTTPAAPAASNGKRGGKKKGYVSDDSKDRILLTAALEVKGMTPYGMAPLLYPLGTRRTRTAAENATLKFRKRHPTEIAEALRSMDRRKAEDIIATIHPK